MREAAKEVREAGWAKPSLLVSKSGWGEYNAFADQHCPWALALKHNLHGSRRSAALLGGNTAGEAKIVADRGLEKAILSMSEPISLDRWSLPTVQKAPGLPSREEKSSRGRPRRTRRKGDEPATDSVVRKVAKVPLRGGAGLPCWGDVYGADHIRIDTAVQSEAASKSRPPLEPRPEDRYKGQQRKQATHAIKVEGRGKSSVYVAQSAPVLCKDRGGGVSHAAHAVLLNVSWQESISGGAETAAEVELMCLRCVVRREALLADVAKALGIAIVGGEGTEWTTAVRTSGPDGSRGLTEPPPETVLLGLFSGLREAAMGVVEAIVAWRSSSTLCSGSNFNAGGMVREEGRRLGAANRSFMYRHENYLLKMVSDTDFLGESSAARSALARINVRVLRGNPFLMPTELAGRTTALQMAATQEESELALKMLCDPLRLRDAERAVLDEARRLAVVLDGDESSQIRCQQERQGANHEQLGGIFAGIARPKSSVLVPLPPPLNRPLEEEEEEEVVVVVAAAAEAEAEAEGQLEQEKGSKTGGDVTIVGGRTSTAARRSNSNRGGGDKNAGNFGGNSNYKRPWTKRSLGLEDQLVARLKELKIEVADRQQGIGELAAELALKRTNVGRLEETISGLTQSLRTARNARAGKKARSLATRTQVASAELEVANKNLREARAALCLDELELRRVMALGRTINQQLKYERERKRVERARRSEERRMNREKAVAIIQVSEFTSFRPLFYSIAMFTSLIHIPVAPSPSSFSFSRSD
jgi:uncharacterized coiled-coil protein SlyX